MFHPTRYLRPFSAAGQLPTHTSHFAPHRGTIQTAPLRITCASKRNHTQRHSHLSLRTASRHNTDGTSRITCVRPSGTAPNFTHTSHFAPHRGTMQTTPPRITCVWPTGTAPNFPLLSLTRHSHIISHHAWVRGAPHTRATATIRRDRVQPALHRRTTKTANTPPPLLLALVSSTHDVPRRKPFRSTTTQSSQQLHTHHRSRITTQHDSDKGHHGSTDTATYHLHPLQRTRNTTQKVIDTGHLGCLHECHSEHTETTNTTAPSTAANTSQHIASARGKHLGCVSELHSEHTGPALTPPPLTVSPSYLNTYSLFVGCTSPRHHPTGDRGGTPTPSHSPTTDSPQGNT